MDETTTNALQEYRIKMLEEQVIKNQETIMEELLNIRQEFQNDHERIIKAELEIQRLNEKLNKYDSYIKMIITTVLAQLLVILGQVILPHLLN